MIKTSDQKYIRASADIFFNLVSQLYIEESPARRFRPDPIQCNGSTLLTARGHLLERRVSDDWKDLKMGQGPGVNMQVTRVVYGEFNGKTRERVRGIHIKTINVLFCIYFQGLSWVLLNMLKHTTNEPTKNFHYRESHSENFHMGPDSHTPSPPEPLENYAKVLDFHVFDWN